MHFRQYDSVWIMLIVINRLRRRHSAQERGELKCKLLHRLIQQRKETCFTSCTAGVLAQRRTKTYSGWFQALQRKKPAAAFMSPHQVGKIPRTAHPILHKVNLPVATTSLFYKGSVDSYTFY